VSLSGASSPFGAVRRLAVFGALVLGANCLRQPNPAYVDLNLNRDAAAGRDAPVSSDAKPDADGVDTRPPAPATEANPIDTRSSPPPDARVDAAKDAAPDVAPEAQLTVSRASYNVGEAIPVTYSNGPGLKSDWIGIYDQAAAPPSDASQSLLWYYSDNTGWGPAQPGPGPKNGTVIFTTGSKGSRQWPLPAGSYKAIFQSSPYTQLAPPANFQVR
jgi:hypothetical protein